MESERGKEFISPEIVEDLDVSIRVDLIRTCPGVHIEWKKERRNR